MRILSCGLLNLSDMEVSQNHRYHWGVPMIRTIVFGVVYIGIPLFRGTAIYKLP